MADINFKTADLAWLYKNGATLDQLQSGTEPDAGGYLVNFRIDGTADDNTAIASLDTRIATFQNAISTGAAAGSEDSPYDAAYLKREFMDEVFGELVKKGYVQLSNVFTGPFSPPLSQGVLDGNGLMSNGPIYSAVQGPPLFPGFPNTYSLGTVIWDGTNFDNMTDATKLADLNSQGQEIYNSYSTWIDAVFAEGNKMANNPVDPTTGAAIASSLMTAVTSRTLPGYGATVFNRVANVNGVTYLVSDDAQTYQAQKTVVNGTRVYYDMTPNNPHPDMLVAGPAIDSTVLPSSLMPGSSTYVQVDANLNPVPGGTSGVMANTNMSPMWYLYFWNEARVRVLRGQLNMKEAVTAEIRDDLARANAAEADLEKQAGTVRAQSADGKTINPDTSLETQSMDYFQAENVKSGSAFWGANANHSYNYADWGTNRSNLKTYIDQKSTQSQDAMLDYQTTLNRFNNAYDVMSKMQEKLDGLLKSQLRNV